MAYPHDADSEPLAGLSGGPDDLSAGIADHRAHPLARRRSWLLAGAVALGLAVVAGIAVTSLRPSAEPVSAQGYQRDGLSGSESTTPPTSAAGAGPTATPSRSSGPTPSAPGRAGTAVKPGPQSVPANPSGSTSPRIINAFITGYSYFDNTPAGSVEISHPILHDSAAGTGTNADPITVAVGHSLVNGRDILDWPAGTRFYIPNLRRYFIVEDTCGDGSSPQNGPCHKGFSAPATTWLDLWIGGKGGSANGSDACMDAITDVWQVVVSPGPNYATVAGGVYGPSGCTRQFGNTILLS